MSECDGKCESQCDDCHDLDNCVEAETRYGDLTLCRDCRRNYPVGQPCYCKEVGHEYCEVHGGYYVTA